MSLATDGLVSLWGAGRGPAPERIAAVAAAISPYRPRSLQDSR
jgi:hypothetical protein